MKIVSRQSYLKNISGSILRRIFLTGFVLMGIAWFFFRTIHSSPSEHFSNALNIVGGISGIPLSIFFLVKVRSFRSLDVRTARFILEYTLYFLVLGFSWPHLVGLVDIIMELDGQSKSALFSFFVIAYLFVKIKLAITYLNSKDQALAVHNLLADPKQKTTLRNENLTATHEAGHVLLYGCMQGHPHDMWVSIRANATSAGRVSSIIFDNSFSSVRLEWQLLLCLAGKEAERYRYGDYSIGCSDDLNQWQSLADLYLRNGMGSFYYSNPANNMQWSHNVKVLEALQGQQETTLAVFFRENDELLSTIEFKLLEKNPFLVKF